MGGAGRAFTGTAGQGSLSGGTLGGSTALPGADIRGGRPASPSTVAGNRGISVSYVLVMSSCYSAMVAGKPLATKVGIPALQPESACNPQGSMGGKLRYDLTDALFFSSFGNATVV